MKNYVLEEYQRNVNAAAVYVPLLKLAFGLRTEVYMSHHIFVVLPDRTVQEIPSADTILFDPDIMGKAFGDRAQHRMEQLARTPVNQREDLVKYWLYDDPKRPLLGEELSDG